VGMEWGPLRIVRITEELLEWKSSDPGCRKLRLMAMGICCTDHAIPSICKKLALTSPTCGSLSVGQVMDKEGKKIFVSRLLLSVCIVTDSWSTSVSLSEIIYYYTLKLPLLFTGKHIFLECFNRIVEFCLCLYL
jgi:hypothetical protein